VIADMGIRDLRRTQTPMEVLIPNMILVETYWNALHIALYKNNLDIVRYLLEDCRIDAACLGRLAKDVKNVDRSPSVDHEAFPLYLAILQNNGDIFNYLWTEHEYFWNTDHLKAVIIMIEEMNRDHFATEVINSKTTYDMFAYLSLDEKMEFMEWLVSKDRKYYQTYRDHMTKKPFRWVYLVIRSKKPDDISSREAEEFQKIGNEITREELEIPDDHTKVEHYHSLIKRLTKMDEDEDNFAIYKGATSKLLEMPGYEKYKGDEDEDKMLADVSEDEGDNQSEPDYDSESEDEDWIPSGEEFCELAEKGDLKRIKLAVSRITPVNILAMTGYEKIVSVGDEEYNTELWNPVLFAINSNRLAVVQYLVREVKANLRLTICNPDKREVEYDEYSFFGMTSLDEIYGLIIALQHKDLKMFDYLWDANYTMWTSGHFLDLFDYLVKNELMEGLVHFMTARTTHEIFIVLKFEYREETFDDMVQTTEGIEDKDIKNYLYAALSESPFSMNMVIAGFEDKERMKYIEKAKGHFKDAEFNYIIFKDEVEIYKMIFEKKAYNDLAQELTKAQAFNQRHFRIQIDQAGILACTPHTTEIPLFDKEPKLAHLNLHKLYVIGGEEFKGKKKEKISNKQAAMDKQQPKGSAAAEAKPVVVPNKLYELIKDKELLQFCEKESWSIPGLALLSKNTELFNNVIEKYRPMLSLMFPLYKVCKDKKGREFGSEMQAMVQYSDDIDVLFNTLENQSEMFVFQEVYYIIKNVLTHGTGAEVKILHSVTVRSYFNFMSEDSKLKLIEEMYDWADENKSTLKALGQNLATSTYLPYLRQVRPEIAEDMEDGNEASDNESEGSKSSKGGSDASASEGSDEGSNAGSSDGSDDSGGEDEENDSSEDSSN
jgi:hypothetical protein